MSRRTPYQSCVTGKCSKFSCETPPGQTRNPASFTPHRTAAHAERRRERHARVVVLVVIAASD
eukprot:1822421-Prymnesium_polylepis.1